MKALTQTRATPVPRQIISLPARHFNNATLQRCTATTECEDCRKKRLGIVQRFATGIQTPSIAPPIVHDVLRSPGQPLDMATRAFMEPRFGHDFSQVRVHNDERAAASARAVNALAYTVGRDVVFGASQYQPTTGEGRKLVAHELTHVVQQGNQTQVPNELRLGSANDAYEGQASAVADSIDHFIGSMDGQVRQQASFTQGTGAASSQIQRACLPAAECAAPRATLTQFVENTNKNPKNISKAERRKKACTKVPRDPACTLDGHGAPATALTAILKANYPSRLGFITGIYVDKDMPAQYGAYTSDCASFMPPLPGGKCTFVPDTLEAEGKLYQGGAAMVGGQSRQDWLTQTIGTLAHETGHAHFDTSAPIAEPSPTSCKFADFQSNLSEMAAHLSEMHVYYRAALSRPEKDRFKKFYEMFDFWVKNGSEDISGIIKDLRCKCECADADYFITKTVESVSTTQKWDSNERSMIHNELRNPKWALKWPVAPPSAIDVNDLPTTAAAPLKFE